jgi:hypothetical protein
VDGYFQTGSAEWSDSSCSQCTLDLRCDPGTFAIPCTKTADSRCSACKGAPPIPGSYVWVSEHCDFRCVEGYYRLNASACAECSRDLSCNPGYYAANCTGTEDAQCLACDEELGLNARWTDGCLWSCAQGFVLSNTSSSCVPAHTVVTSMKMKNTIAEVCAEIETLLQSMSQTLSSLSEDGVQYTSRITELEGIPCVHNVCPQCVHEANRTQLPRRRLLTDPSSVSVTIVSTANTDAGSTISPQEIQSMLQNSLSESALFVAGIIRQGVLEYPMNPTLVGLTCALSAALIFFMLACFCRWCRQEATQSEVLVQTAPKSSCAFLQSECGNEFRARMMMGSKVK